ncbi:neuropilin and tolloid-like protein 2 [Plakobranchus ocellatus]|uniref:Neuropilin and tolloid-like protein 2 n=1 Tax=Plakobranchus ocellatus TaxID=259542 RepID=A0AAV4C948_9GAST|nr:neuropilin and tolloid-like protein 2 [Plakobranchus ocellatus]
MTSCVPIAIAIVTIFSSFVSPGSPPSKECDRNFSRYTSGVTGVFSSPNFPNPYPSLLRCTFLFDASANGGVEIKFDSFELEDKNDEDDAYDYIEISTIDSAGVKQKLNTFCGDRIPQTIISPLSKLEIKFVSDHWFDNNRGFNGTYRFLGDEWQPFDHKQSKCGNAQLSGPAGFIYSPNYPDSYPKGVNCSWIINVPEDKQILVRLEDLDIGPENFGKCRHSALRLYNGFANEMTIQTLEWCGKLSEHQVPELEYVTSTNRTVLRFVSSNRPQRVDQNGHRGFKLLWMALRVLEPGEECPDFHCEGGQYCPDGKSCISLPRYCIPKQLVCDGVHNCGPYDDSDERRCTLEIVIMAACIAVPSLLVLMLVVLVAVCYNHRHVRKSASQEQPLANSNSQGTASRDSFSSNHRQMMVHTSFIDGTGAMTFDPDNDPNNDITDIDQETTHGLFTSSSNGYTNSLRSHKKRPSYHMMQQSYEDGTMVVAQI